MNTNNKVETTVIGIDCLAKGIDAAIAPYTFGIPVVQLIENFVTIGKNIYDNRLIKKILELFDNTDYKDEKARQKMEDFFIKKIEGAKYQQTNGELLLEVVDHLDDVRKAGLIGKVLSYCLNNGIKKEDFFKITYLVSKSYYEDLIVLQRFANKISFVSSEDTKLDTLFSYGFLDNIGIDGGSALNHRSSSKSGTIYKLNRYGKLLARIMRDMSKTSV